MATNSTNSPRSSLVLPTLVVVVTASAAALLLLLGLVIWLADAIGSLTGALLLTGGALGLVAWCVYKVSLSPTLRRLRDEYEQFVALVALLKGLYDCALLRLSQLLSLLK